MLDIFWTIVIFTLMLVIFKFFERFKVNTLQAIIVNYIVAGLCGIVAMGDQFDFKATVTSDYLPFAMIVGILFIITFNLMAFSTQKLGFSITTVANKMSLVIAVGFGIIYLGEAWDYLQLIGVALALIAIYLTSTSGGKISFNKKYLWVVLILFFGQGIADSALNYANKFYVPLGSGPAFISIIFLFAALFGTFYLIYISAKNKTGFAFKSILWGILLGIPNYFTLHFFVRALSSGVMESSKVFPTVNMGVIVLSALIGYFFFKEKLSKQNWSGVLLASIAISIITFSSEIIRLFWK